MPHVGVDLADTKVVNAAVAQLCSGRELYGVVTAAGIDAVDEMLATDGLGALRYPGSAHLAVDRRCGRSARRPAAPGPTAHHCLSGAGGDGAAA